MHENNSFITLTYRVTEQPAFGSLDLDHWQKFMKRFRRRAEQKYGIKRIRFFACGEYGENLDHSLNGKLGHPHYHACIFGFDFPDKQLWQVRDSVKLYRSKFLEELWPYGYSSIGDVTFESAAYTARYVLKKHLGKDADFYDLTNPYTGEFERLKPEFTVMSRRPGIGKPWYDKFKDDLRKDFITSRGTKMLPPKFYDKQLEKEDPHRYEQVKEKRKLDAAERLKDDYFDRLRDGEKIKEKKVKQLPRSLQNEN